MKALRMATSAPPVLTNDEKNKPILTKENLSSRIQRVLDPTQEISTPKHSEGSATSESLSIDKQSVSLFPNVKSFVI